jgi:SAM-dependent methyltransferase
VSAAQDRPSTWYAWHASIIGQGTRVLDVACGHGRHAIAAAGRGASVVAVDSDPGRLAEARKAARQLAIEWVCADLAVFPLPPQSFDVVMMFSYLDRGRMKEYLEAVKPGGYLLSETFLESQREHGWGPTAAEHLLRPGELLELVGPFEVVLAREVLEFIGGRPAAVASILARRAQ